MFSCRAGNGLLEVTSWGSLQRSPKGAGFKGPTSKGREGRGRRGERKGKEGPFPKSQIRPNWIREAGLCSCVHVMLSCFQLSLICRNSVHRNSIPIPIVRLDPAHDDDDMIK